MEKDINCLNFKGLFGYIEARYGEESLRRLFRNAVGSGRFLIPNKNSPDLLEPVTLEHLTDESYWISNELSLALLGSIKTVVPGPFPEQTAGQGAILENLSNRDLFFCKLMGPKALVRKAARLNAKFNRTKEVRVTRLEDTAATVDLHYRPGFRVTKDVCNWNLGIYIGLARTSGARSINAVESKCVLNGDDHCRIDLEWKVPSILQRTYTSVLRLLTRELISEYERTVLDRDRLIETLRASEYQYRMLIESSTDGVCIIQDETICYTNPRFHEIFSALPEELDQMPFPEFFHPDDRDSLSQTYRHCISGRKVPGLQVARTVDKSGSIRFMELNTSCIKWQGSPGVLAFMRDITEQKRTQEMLVQSEKMMSVGGLAAGMAQEINNPLAGMMQNAQVALNRLSKRLPANQSAAEKAGTTLETINAYMEERGVIKLLEHIHNAGTHAAGIVENMLSFARKGDSRKKHHDLVPILEKSIQLARNDWDLNRNYDFNAIKIIRDYAPDLPPVPCEAGKIQQVIFNVIKNAAHAMHVNTKDNQIPRLTLGLKIKQSMACIEIQDNGPGMDLATQKRIFEPFFTTKSVDKGTGLGLSVSYFIVVDEHKGEMDVRSAPGEGTVIIIRLPST
ncbi:MAG: PAS domain S-box protein [Pseudomonadota bacterium]